MTVSAECFRTRSPTCQLLLSTVHSFHGRPVEVVKPNLRWRNHNTAHEKAQPADLFSVDAPRLFAREQRRFQAVLLKNPSCRRWFFNDAFENPLAEGRMRSVAYPSTDK